MVCDQKVIEDQYRLATDIPNLWYNRKTIIILWFSVNWTRNTWLADRMTMAPITGTANQQAIIYGEKMKLEMVLQFP